MWWIIGFGVVIVIAVVVLKEREKEAARRKYENSLESLRRSPTSSGLRQKTLTLGRAYANLTRDRKGVALFDEVALMNDLNAAAGGTMAIADGGQRRHDDGTSSVEARLNELADLLRKGLITQEDHDTRKGQILEEV